MTPLEAPGAGAGLGDGAGLEAGAGSLTGIGAKPGGSGRSALGMGRPFVWRLIASSYCFLMRHILLALLLFPASRAFFSSSSYLASLSFSDSRMVVGTRGASSSSSV